MILIYSGNENIVPPPTRGDSESSYVRLDSIARNELLAACYILYTCQRFELSSDNLTQISYTLN